MISQRQQNIQQLDVIADIRQLVDLWQEYRFHSRELYRCKKEIRGICYKHGMKGMRFISLLLLFSGFVLCAIGENVTLAWDAAPTDCLGRK